MEITMVEKMSTMERLKHAKKRRAQQLKKFSQYEKQLDKDNKRKTKQSAKKGGVKRQRSTKVVFVPNVTLLEAATRNDIEEGEWRSCIMLYKS